MNLLKSLPEITLIVIAHRLVTIKSADKIVYISDGNLKFFNISLGVKVAFKEFLFFSEGWIAREIDKNNKIT